MFSFTVYQCTTVGSKAFRVVFGDHVKPNTEFGTYRTRVYQGISRADCIETAIAGESRRDIIEQIKRFRASEMLKALRSEGDGSTPSARESRPVAGNGGAATSTFPVALLTPEDQDEEGSLQDFAPPHAPERAELDAILRAPPETVPFYRLVTGDYFRFPAETIRAYKTAHNRYRYEGAEMDDSIGEGNTPVVRLAITEGLS